MSMRTQAACLKASSASRRFAYAAYLVLDNREGQVQQHQIFTHSVEAIAAGFAIAAHHGRTIIVRQHDRVADEAVLHFFTIKKGAWQGLYEDGQTGLRKAYPYRAERLFRINEKLTEPWSWTPGCDVVGGDRDLIEGVLS